MGSPMVESVLVDGHATAPHLGPWKGSTSHWEVQPRWEQSQALHGTRVKPESSHPLAVPGEIKPGVAEEPGSRRGDGLWRW